MPGPMRITSYLTNHTTSSGTARATPGKREPPPCGRLTGRRSRRRRLLLGWRGPVTGMTILERKDAGSGSGGSRLLDEICPFVYFKEAVRLVVLVQTSSASIERVFSQVKRILASVGENILEDNLELRLLRRCCKKLEEMTSSWT